MINAARSVNFTFIIYSNAFECGSNNLNVSSKRANSCTFAANLQQLRQLSKQGSLSCHLARYLFWMLILFSDIYLRTKMNFNLHFKLFVTISYYGGLGGDKKACTKLMNSARYFFFVVNPFAWYIVTYIWEQKWFLSVWYVVTYI